jgi:hypothetical protein
MLAQLQLTVLPTNWGEPPSMISMRENYVVIVCLGLCSAPNVRSESLLAIHCQCSPKIKGLSKHDSRCGCILRISRCHPCLHPSPLHHAPSLRSSGHAIGSNSSSPPAGGALWGPTLPDLLANACLSQKRNLKIPQAITKCSLIGGGAPQKMAHQL